MALKPKLQTKSSGGAKTKPAILIFTPNSLLPDAAGMIVTLEDGTKAVLRMSEKYINYNQGRDKSFQPKLADGSINQHIYAKVLRVMPSNPLLDVRLNKDIATVNAYPNGTVSTPEGELPVYDFNDFALHARAEMEKEDPATMQKVTAPADRIVSGIGAIFTGVSADGNPSAYVDLISEPKSFASFADLAAAAKTYIAGSRDAAALYVRVNKGADEPGETVTFTPKRLDKEGKVNESTVITAEEIDAYLADLQAQGITIDQVAGYETHQRLFLGKAFTDKEKGPKRLEAISRNAAFAGGYDTWAKAEDIAAGKGPSVKIIGAETQVEGKGVRREPVSFVPMSVAVTLMADKFNPGQFVQGSVRSVLVTGHAETEPAVPAAVRFRTVAEREALANVPADQTPEAGGVAADQGHQGPDQNGDELPPADLGEGGGPEF